MARFKVYVSDMASNQVFEYETDGLFMSIPNEEGANVLFGTDMYGKDIINWVSVIGDQLEDALKKEPKLYAAVTAYRLYKMMIMDDEEEE